MRNLLSILFITMLGGLNAQTLIYLPEPYGDNFIESELIENVSIIPLQVERFGMIEPDMEMKVDGNDFFILDNKKTQCVYHFNNQGELLNTICKKKNSVEANNNLPVLNNPVKFSLNPYLQKIDIYNFENSIINQFNYDGSEAGNIELSISPSDFVSDIRENYWIYTGWNRKETQYRLLRTDKNGNILERRMRLVTKCTPTEGYTFYISEGGICFWELLGDKTYIIENKQIKLTYQFDFGAHNLPANYHSDKADESFTMINQTGYYTVKKYIENKNFVYFFLNYNTIDELEMFHVIHDKKTGRINIYTENSAIGAFDKAQHITENDELVFLVSPRKIRQLLTGGTEFVPATFMDLSDTINRMRNPIILKMKLQSIDNNNKQYQNENIDSLYFNN